MEDAVLYKLHRVHTYLEDPGCCVMILFFDFSSAFNTMQPLILRDKLEAMGVYCFLTSWMTDYLTEWPSTSGWRTVSPGWLGTALVLHKGLSQHRSCSRSTQRTFNTTLNPVTCKNVLTIQLLWLVSGVVRSRSTGIWRMPSGTGAVSAVST